MCVFKYNEEPKLSIGQNECCPSDILSKTEFLTTRSQLILMFYISIERGSNNLQFIYKLFKNSHI